MKRGLAILVVGVLLAACIPRILDYGPTNPEVIESVMSRDTTISDHVVYFAPAVWYPGADGFRLSAPQQVWLGTIVLGDKAVYFLIWDKLVLDDRILYSLAQDKPKHRVDYGAVNSVEVRAFGLGRRIVVRTQESTHIDSFDIVDDTGNWNDQEGTKRVCEDIARLAHRQCQLPP